LNFKKKDNNNKRKMKKKERKRKITKNPQQTKLSGRKGGGMNEK
jgi:hypothetical protein